MMEWRIGKDKRERRGHASPAGVLHRQKAQRITLAVAIAAVLAVPPVFVNHPIGYLPLLAYAFILLACWAYLRAIVRGFAVEHGFAESSCPRGGAVELPIVLKNRSRLPILRARPQVYVKNPHGALEREVLAIAMVDAKGDDRISVNVRLGHVGAYTAGLKGVVLYDPLMLFQTYRDVSQVVVLVSTPCDLIADAVEFSDMAVHESRTPVRTVLSDNVDYAGTRDYEYGDPLKSVHWKLSARAGELQTRLFEASVNTKMSVIMDFHAPDYDTEALMGCADVVIEAALAVMRLGMQRNVEVSLCYVDEKGSKVSRALPRAEEVDRFVASLPLLSAQVSAEDVLGIVDEEVARFGGSDSVVLCTATLSRELVARAVEIRAAYLSASIVVAVPRERSRAFYKDNQGILNELSNAGVPCIVLSDASELEWSGGHE